jgi:NAD(P)H-nitrite reductase large subunit
MYIRRVDLWQILQDWAIKHGVQMYGGKEAMGVDPASCSVFFEQDVRIQGDMVVGADGLCTIVVFESPSF